MVDVKSLLHDTCQAACVSFYVAVDEDENGGEKKMRNILKVIKNVIYIRS